MRVAVLAVVAYAAVGCASSQGERWQRADGSAPDPAQLRDDRLECLNRIGAPAPQSASPLGATRNQLIDCMRMKGWTRS